MFAFLIKHSLVCMFLAALAGFLLPTASQALFPFLPYVLFTVMVLTLVGIRQNALITLLMQPAIWLYSLYHAFGLMLVTGGIAYLLGADSALLLAIVAVAATGSLFATPAIVRALGLDTLRAMAMTISTTLLLPIALYGVLWILPVGEGELDLQAYLLRLLIFIIAPMMLSFLLHRFVPQDVLNKALVTLSPYTILFVFAFPFGLIGSFRLLWDQDPMTASQYLAIAVGLCGIFYSSAFFYYRRYGVDQALMSAVTSGNRNVLLTYTIGGALLGPAFLPLAGAIQLPTYFIPVMTRWLARRLKS